MSDYQTYCRALTSLVDHPIEFTEEAFIQLAPHIHSGMFGTIFKLQPVKIAIPSTKVIYSFNILVIEKNKITFGGPGRTEKSKPIFLTQLPVNDENLLYMDEAVNYAMIEWKNELIIDDWARDAVVVYNICDPTKKLGGYTGGCEFLRYVYAIYRNGFFNAYSKNARDEDLVILSSNIVMSYELSFGKVVHWFWICNICKKGMSHDQCTGCKKKYPSDILIDRRNLIVDCHPLLFEFMKK